MSVMGDHNKAMAICEKADITLSKAKNDWILAHRKALPFEEKAARAKGMPEPSRSIFFRSAASIANCGCLYEKAIELAKEGLAGSPPAQIAKELRDELNRARKIMRKLGMTKPANAGKGSES